MTEQKSSLDTRKLIQGDIGLGRQARAGICAADDGDHACLGRLRSRDVQHLGRSGRGDVVPGADDMAIDMDVVVATVLAEVVRAWKLTSKSRS